ncbi:MAG: pyridoxal-phosphate dependent enzyme [Paracoccaceae bacterium]|nr:pyridoxal-phosphate dependent enzyme [Paracoccaceae bacterium]
MPKHNVFSGPNAIRDFLDPGQLPHIPLVEIPESLNPFNADGVRIYGKMMSLLALGNLKALPAYNMIAEKYARGELTEIDRLIENSSGNTVSSLALVARQFGIEHTSSYVPSEISWNKLLMLLFFGIEPIVNEEPSDPTGDDPQSGINKAKRDAQAEDTWNPGQYDNPDNPAAHAKWTGPQIWDQTDGKLSLFCASLGTTGTIIGTSTFLKSKRADLPIVGVMRAPDNYVPGPRTEKLLNLVGFDWRAHVDHIEQAQTAESYRLSMELSRRGMLAGPSSGLGLSGLLQHLQAAKDEGRLDSLRNVDGEVCCVFVCCDGPYAYLDEYEKYVPPAHFPEVRNKELLKNKP